MKKQTIRREMKRYFSKTLMFAALSGFIYFWPFLAQGVLFDGGPKILAKSLNIQSTASFSKRF